MATDSHITDDSLGTPLTWRVTNVWSDLHLRFGNLKVRLLWAVVVFQAVCASVFAWELWSEVLGLRSFQLPWFLIEIIQMFSSLGLLLGVIVTSLFLRNSIHSLNRMREQIDVASGNFQGHIKRHFTRWGFSPSEMAVATYAMKGFSNQEIAELRGTSCSTVKTQMQAIFRKSDLANRQQLISFLVEELMSGVTLEDED